MKTDELVIVKLSLPIHFKVNLHINYHHKDSLDSYVFFGRLRRLTVVIFIHFLYKTFDISYCSFPKQVPVPLTLSKTRDKKKSKICWTQKMGRLA